MKSENKISAPSLVSGKDMEGSIRRKSVTGNVTVRMTETTSPSTSPAMVGTCDCSKSLKRITTLFSTWQRALRSSGVLDEEKKTGGRKRRKRSGGFQSRGRRKLRRAQERMSMTASPPRAPTTSPSITSCLASDGVYMEVIEGGDDLPDLIEGDDDLPDLEGQEYIELAGPASQLAIFQRENYSGHRLNNARCQQKAGEFRSAGQQHRPDIVDRHVSNVPLRMHETLTRSSPPGRHRNVASFRWERSSQKDFTPRGHRWHSPAGRSSGGSRWSRAAQSLEGSLSASRTNAKVSNGKKCIERQIGYFETSEQQAVPD